MLEVLISGKLFRDPQVRVGQSGKPFTTALVRVPVDNGEESILASTIAFGEVGERLARLKSGDAVSIAGSAKLSSWEKDGETRHGLGVTASAILSAYDTRKRRAAPKEPGSAAPEPSKGGDTDFEDQIPF